MTDLETRLSDLRLTEWTSCGGCAAKWGASLLSSLVSDFPTNTDPSLLVGLAPFDDAAVYRISDDLAMVSTTDARRLAMKAAVRCDLVMNAPGPVRHICSSGQPPL